MMLSRKISYFIVAFTFLIAAFLYSSLPDVMASHWNAQGQVDGYMPKWLALFIMPGISVVLLVMFEFLPRIDPLRKNYAGFGTQYGWFVASFLAFLLYLYIMTLAWNFGINLNMTQALAPAFGALFYVVGMLVQKAKRNWFVGIRTPWTMSSDSVWNKTHKLGGELFKAAGIIMVLGLFLPDIFFPLMLAVMSVVVIVPFVYSYIEYNKEKGGKKKSAGTKARKKRK